MTTELERLVMLPCPFCGKSVDMDDPDTIYPIGLHWVDDPEIGRHYVDRKRLRFLPMQHATGECWEIHCVRHAGGCGAEIAADSRDDAIAMWQRRAT